MRALLGLVLAAFAAWSGAQPAPAEAGWSALQDGSVILFRHAIAPGVGDPPGFRLGDCSTQRNLDEAGRDQARRIGEAFRRQAVKVGAVLTSPWCRTRETAELAFPRSSRQDDADFSSFFDDSARQPAQTARAQATLLRWRGPGVLVVVTHQVNISALTGVSPTSGEGVVVKPDGTGLAVVTRLQP